MKHPVAFWAGTSAAFGSVVGITGAQLITGDKVFETGIAAIFTAVTVSASVYATERLKEARRDEPDR